MIHIFKKFNGERVAIDLDSILEINDKIEYTEIQTVVRKIRLDHDFEQVVNLVAQYHATDDDGNINFSKN
jgi:hypothetical protein